MFSGSFGKLQAGCNMPFLNSGFRLATLPQRPDRHADETVVLRAGSPTSAEDFPSSV